MNNLESHSVINDAYTKQYTFAYIFTLYVRITSTVKKENETNILQLKRFLIIIKHEIIAIRCILSLTFSTSE